LADAIFVRSQQDAAFAVIAAWEPNPSQVPEKISSAARRCTEISGEFAEIAAGNDCSQADMRAIKLLCARGGWLRQRGLFKRH